MGHEGYDFYCTHCASKQNAKTVLYDMKGLLSPEGQVNILKLRLSEAELRALQAQGKRQENNLYQCTVRLPELLGYMANQNNLNLPGLPGLTMEQIREFVAYIKEAQPTPTPGDSDEEDDFDSVEEKTPAAVQHQSQKREWSPIIQDLIRRDQKTDTAEEAEGRLRTDLRLLSNLFSNGETCTFGLRLETDKDDRGEEIVISTSIHNGLMLLDLDNRVCGKCGEKIFKAAGTAEHKSVVFIGDQSAGKTSTILALTHYAREHLRGDLGGQIWRGAATIPNVREITLLSPAERLVHELSELFPNGIAPQKTDVKQRESAYSATFLVTSGKDGERKKILTLMDLPGELCKWGGELQVNTIRNEFPVALACDTFVVCFDTSVVERAQGVRGGNGNGGGENKMPNLAAGNNELREPGQVVNDTCQWANEFQKLLVANTNKTNYVPAILVFTKCRDLEAGEENSKTGGPILSPEDRVYRFQDERSAINKNAVFGFACEQFGKTGNLGTAYNAVLRASPYGYPAPAENEVVIEEKNGKVISCYPKEEGKPLHPPTPKNIDKLMRWLLMVSGCIPTEGVYTKEIGAAVGGYQLRDYVLTRPQLRTQKPLYPGENPDEALARCALFANPTDTDKEYLRSYADKPRRLALKVKAKFQAAFQHGGRN